jgi:hypothetical protein
MLPARTVSLCAAALLACAGGGEGQAEASPTADAAAPSVPSPATDPGPASVVIEALDTAAECAGVVPASAPAPVLFRRQAAAGATCLGGTSDGTGAVVVGARAADGTVTWQALSGDGRPQGAFTAWPLLPQPRGWHGLATDGAAIRAVAVAPDGAIAAGTVVSPDPALWTNARATLAGDPAGGSAAISRAVTIAGNHWHAVFVRRLDAAGAPRADAARVETGSDANAPWFMGAGVSTAGEALVLLQDSSFVDAIWTDASGAIVASSTQQEPSSGVVGDGLRHEVDAAALLDGSLVVRSDGTWRRRYGRLATRSGPLPAWLSERAAWGLRITRGNRGYAALEPGGLAAPDCAQRIELLAPSGRLCGRVTFHEGGTGCTTGALDQGWDGTVVQQSGKDSCTVRWWPRLLAGP